MISTVLNTLRHALATLAALLVLAPSAPAQERFPERPVTLIVPYAPGGPTDQHLRVVAEEAGRQLGQNVIIDNRPGANGTNGASALARANPDGYTVAILPASVYREPHIAKVSYDPTSFSYLLLMSDYSFGLAVRADSPWKTWADLVADAKRRPGRINVGATGAIGTPRIVIEEAAEAAGVEFNVVPFKGDAEVTNAILGGHLDAAPLSGVAVPHIEAGKMRYLVMLTEKRVKRYPDLPTLRESGLAHHIDSPYGLAGPKGLDPVRARILHDAFHKALESSASLKAMELLNQQPNYKAFDDYRQYAMASLAREKERVARLRAKGLLP